jgi:hypothetical protein
LFLTNRPHREAKENRGSEPLFGEAVQNILSKIMTLSDTEAPPLVPQAVLPPTTANISSLSILLSGVCELPRKNSTPIRTSFSSCLTNSWVSKMNEVHQRSVNRGTVTPPPASVIPSSDLLNSSQSKQRENEEEHPPNEASYDAVTALLTLASGLPRDVAGPTSTSAPSEAPSEVPSSDQPHSTSMPQQKLDRRSLIKKDSVEYKSVLHRFVSIYAWPMVLSFVPKVEVGSLALPGYPSAPTLSQEPPSESDVSLAAETAVNTPVSRPTRQRNAVSKRKRFTDEDSDADFDIAEEIASRRSSRASK